MAGKLRVAQVGTGNVGARALRRIIEHPDLELVGVRVYAVAKAGRDAGELAGLAPVGIAAVADLASIVALRPDCVLYMPNATDIDEIAAMLTAGINIVTTRPDFHNPEYLHPVARARIEDACRIGNASIHSTGSSPGFSTEALPLVLASLQRRVDRVEIHEYGDVSSRASPEMILDGMGFGKPVGPPNQGRLDHLRQAFGPSLAMTAAKLGLTVDDLRVEGSLATARCDTPIAAGLVKAGTVAAQRNRVIGMNGDTAVISFSATWYVTTDVEMPTGDPWSFGSSGWRILMHGDTPLDVHIGFPVEPEDYAAFTPNLTAHRPVNSVAHVCAAPPGFVTTADLPIVLNAAANAVS